MPTLAEILASKGKKQETIKQQALPMPEILTSPSDIHHILAFLFLLDNPHQHQDFISLLSYFNIPYTPHITKAAEESPSSSLAFLVARYYNQKYPVRSSMERAAFVLAGIGRVLNDRQQALLTEKIERKMEYARESNS